MNHNQGDNVNAVGSHALQYNEGDDNIVIGDESFSDFRSDASKTKQVSAYTQGQGLFTVTAHGFGAVGDNIILLIQFNGAIYNGITNNTGYTFEVIDADTVKILGEAIFGTTNPQLATLTPQLAPLENVNIIGNNIQPTVSNQVILGNDQITCVEL